MRLKKIIAIMALGTCVASYSACAFAATTDTATETASTAVTADADGKGGRGRGDGQGRGGNMTDRYADLLSNGTISQTTYDAITAYLAANMPERPDNADGTAPADGSTEDANRPERKDFLADLVTAGTLSQTTYDAINTYREAQREERKANAPADSASTDTANTAAPADAPEGTPDGKGKGRGGNGGDDTQWSDMVTAGIITEEECTAITAAMEAARPADADGTVPADGTDPADGKEGTDDNHTRMEDTLLSAGIITQDEYAAITAAMEAARPADAGRTAPADGTAPANAQ